MKLQVINADATLKQISLNNKTTLIAQKGQTFVLDVDSSEIETNKQGENLLLSKKNDNEPFLVIEKYYAEADTIFYLQVQGQPYVLTFAMTETAHDLATIVSNDDSALPYVLGGGALFGVAALVGGGGSSNNDEPTNHAPTDINLNNVAVDENAKGAVIGTLTTTDVDANDTFKYSVNGDRFEVVEGVLKLKDENSLDFETSDTVELTLTATDAEGKTVSVAKTITVTDIQETGTTVLDDDILNNEDNEFVPTDDDRNFIVNSLDGDDNIKSRR